MAVDDLYRWMGRSPREPRWEDRGTRHGAWAGRWLRFLHPAYWRAFAASFRAAWRRHRGLR